MPQAVYRAAEAAGSQSGPDETQRALAIAELRLCTPASMRDPARCAFVHGSRHGTPYPFDGDA